MFFTQNPIGSSATEDLQDNAISFDYAMNSPAALWQDRFGKQHKTVQQALKDVGFKPAGFDFVSGGTLGIGDRDKCIFYPTDGYWYSWNGKLPYVIPANSSPTPGGKKGWAPVIKNGEVIAREALRRTYLDAGLNLVEGSFETGGVLNTVSDVLLHEKTGKVYSWNGEFPKVISPGLDLTGFVDVAVKGTFVFTPPPAIALNNMFLQIGHIVTTSGYFSSGDNGAGVYVITAGTSASSLDIPISQHSFAKRIVENGTVTSESLGCVGGQLVTEKLQSALDDPRVNTILIGPVLLYVEDLKLRSYKKLKGKGRDVTILQTPTGSNKFTLGINIGSDGSPDPDLNVKGVIIEDIHIKGNLLTDGGVFNEHIHCFTASGFTDLTMTRCKISEFRGDGIYLGGGNWAYRERYNYNFVANDLIIDGIDRTNRNGMSIITIDGFHLSNFAIKNVARNDMPGAIDFEPNGSSWYKIKNVVIENGSIENTTKGIGVLIGNISLETFENFKVKNVSIRSSSVGVSLCHSRRKVDLFSTPNNVEIQGCSIKSVKTPISMKGVYNALVDTISVEDCSSGFDVGLPSNSSSPVADAETSCKDIKFIDSLFLNVGNDGIFGKLHKISGFVLTNNRLYNCGNRGTLLSFTPDGDTGNVEITNNTLKNVVPGDLILAYHGTGAKTTETTNRFNNNTISVQGSINNQFKAFLTDLVPTNADRFTTTTDGLVFAIGVSRTHATVGLPNGLESAIYETHKFPLLGDSKSGITQKLIGISSPVILQRMYNPLTSTWTSWV